MPAQDLRDWRSSRRERRRAQARFDSWCENVDEPGEQIHHDGLIDDDCRGDFLRAPDQLDWTKMTSASRPQEGGAISVTYWRTNRAGSPYV